MEKTTSLDVKPRDSLTTNQFLDTIDGNLKKKLN